MDNWDKLEITLFILWPFVVGWIIYRKRYIPNEGDDNHQNNHTNPQMENKKNFRDYYFAGRNFQGEKKYSEAIKSFNNALIEAKDVFEFKDVSDRLGECYYGAKDFYMAIFWFNKSLELPVRNLDALERRYICFKELKMHLEAFEDATIYKELCKGTLFSITRKLIHFELDDLLEEVAMVETKQFCEGKVLPHSNLRYARFYSSFDKIIPQDEQNQSDLAWILKSKSYDKLLEFFFGKHSIENKQNFISKYGTKGLFSYDLIHCTCQYLQGRYDDCVEILEHPKTELELVFFEYVKLHLDKNKHTVDFIEKFKDFKNKKNPTVRFWFAKFCDKNIYIDYHDYCNVLQSIKRGKPFVYAEILRNYNRHASDKFEKLEKEALSKFGHDEHILIECCKRYVFKKDKDNLLRILNIMNKDSAAYMFYTGMYHSISGDQIRKIYALKKTIETDSTFYEAYLRFRLDYDDKDSGLALQYLNESLKIVSCYDEAYTSIKEIIRIENIQKVNRNKQKYDK